MTLYRCGTCGTTWQFSKGDRTQKHPYQYEQHAPDCPDTPSPARLDDYKS